MAETVLLMSALLFGGMLLYSFGFAAFLFTSLPAETAGPLIRKAFPHFYLFVLVSSAAAGGLVLSFDMISAGLLAGIALTTIYARQVLMPAINAATDSGNKNRFKWLHGFSVFITLAHISVVGFVIVRVAQIGF